MASVGEYGQFYNCGVHADTFPSLTQDNANAIFWANSSLLRSTFKRMDTNRGFGVLVPSN